MRRRIYTLYLLLNKLNKKKYIGLTYRPLNFYMNKRFREAEIGRFPHRLLFNAIRKYGRDSFEFKSLKKGLTLKQVIIEEVKAIKKYKSYYLLGKGYNMTYGGEGISGYKFSKKCREKMSKDRSGTKSVWYGKHHSPESIEKCRVAKLGKLNAAYGKKQSKKNIKKRVKAICKNYKYKFKFPNGKIKIIHNFNEFIKKFDLCWHMLNYSSHHTCKGFTLLSKKTLKTTVVYKIKGKPRFG